MKGFIIDKSSIRVKIATGGGIFRFTNLANLIFLAILVNPIFSKIYADDLHTLCGGNADCQIARGGVITTITNGEYRIYNAITISNNTSIRDFTNSGTILLGQNGIVFQAGSSILNDFINTGTIDFTPGSLNPHIISGNINAIINNGTIGGGISLTTQYKPTIRNTGTMGGINHNGNDIVINNTGTINLYFETNNNKLAHLVGTATTRPTVQNYAIKITENQTTFNTFTGYNYNGQTADKTQLVGKTSHWVIKNVPFANFTFDTSTKIYIDIDSAFELGKAYLISKIITDANGVGMLPSSYFNILALKNADIYTLTQQGEYFIISGAGNNINTPITALYKSNIKVMNNMFINSNAMIFRQSAKRTTNRTIRTNPSNQRRAIRRVSSLFDDFGDLQIALADNDKIEAIDSARNDSYLALESLESNEHFFYTQNRALQTRRTTNAMWTANTARTRTNQNYYFLFTPFVNHNYFYEAGNYQLSGLDGGFITAFSGKLDFANTLGVHFGFGYGVLSDRDDKDFSIKNANLMLGLNYKLDLIWDMYIKARGDLFVFLNEVSSSSVAKIKPNNLGFGISGAYGKDFNFRQYGVLGLELGFDYKALNATTISVKSALDNSSMQDYNKALYHLLYLDLGVSYDKYFSSRVGLWGFNVGAGARGNLAPKLANSKIVIAGRSLNLLLDNDKILGYVNLGGSFVMSVKRSVMEFGLSYNGNFGDRSMSNGGSFEWRVAW